MMDLEYLKLGYDKIIETLKQQVYLIVNIHFFFFSKI